MATLSNVLFYVIVILLVISAVLGRRLTRHPARIGILLLALSIYPIYEYVSQLAYENFNIRADILILIGLLTWAAISNRSRPRTQVDPASEHMPENAALIKAPEEK